MQASLLLIIELALCCLSESRFIKQQAPMRPFLDCDPVHEAAVGVGFDLTPSGNLHSFRLTKRQNCCRELPQWLESEGCES